MLGEWMHLFDAWVVGFEMCFDFCVVFFWMWVFDFVVLGRWCLMGELDVGRTDLLQQFVEKDLGESQNEMREEECMFDSKC